MATATEEKDSRNAGEKRSKTRGPSKSKAKNRGARDQPATSPGAVPSSDNRAEREKKRSSGKSRTRSSNSSLDRTGRKPRSSSSSFIKTPGAVASTGKGRRKGGSSSSSSKPVGVLSSSGRDSSKGRSGKSDKSRASKSGSSRSRVSSRPSNDKKAQYLASNTGSRAMTPVTTENDIETEDKEAGIVAEAVREVDEDTRREEQEDLVRKAIENERQRMEGLREEELRLEKMKKRRINLVLVLFVLAGGGAALYFALKGDKSSQLPSADTTTDVVVAPNATVNPTEMKTSILTDTPSSAPTDELVYDAPSDEDCQRIADGLPPLNEESMFIRNFDVPLDIGLSSDTDPAAVIPELEDKVRAYIASQIIGCPVPVQRRLDGHSRQLRNIKYMIADAEVRVTYDNEDCVATSSDKCSVVRVALAVKLRGDERNFSVILLLGGYFEQDKNLSDDLKLSTVMESCIRRMMIESKDPTFSPTSAPTEKPSVTPTPLPTLMTASSSPSMRPVSEPILTASSSPSMRPVSEPPTKAPTKAPTMTPTKAPTPPPTFAPFPGTTPSPTRTPTKSPTKNPTKSPTIAPSKLPTPVPTMLPSESPSAGPSAAPSFSPSVVASASPSRSPSNQPSSTPSNKPSAAPSVTPSNNPSSSPSIDWNPIIRFEEGAVWNRQGPSVHTYSCIRFWQCTSVACPDLDPETANNVVEFTEIELEPIPDFHPTNNAVWKIPDANEDFLSNIGRGADTAMSTVDCFNDPFKGRFQVDLIGTGYSFAEGSLVSFNGFDPALRVDVDGTLVYSYNQRGAIGVPLWDRNATVPAGSKKVEGWCGGWGGSCRSQLFVTRD